MLNFDRWQLYTKNFTSPQSWIDFGWYFLISACLQRRVWYYGEDGLPLYCNQYGVMVGPPGLGKGLVLGEVARFLKHHKYTQGNKVITNAGPEYQPLFPVGADSITFEELLCDLAASIRHFKTPDNKVYAHTSYVFALEELASLMKRKTEDVIKFLQNAYDCKDYDYKTKHQGKDLIRKLCVSLLAATQPDFLQEASESRLFGQGFASRALFLFETQPRFYQFHISNFSPEQCKCRDELLEWVKKLSGLYGQIHYDEKTYAWLEDWMTKEYPKQVSRASHKMQDYMARKKVIMQKIAAARHFGENLSMSIPLETFQWALKFLDSIEPQMEAGLTMGGKNPLANYIRRMLVTIKLAPAGIRRRELILEYGGDIELDQIETCLRTLQLGYGVKVRVEGSERVYYVDGIDAGSG